MRRLFPFLRRPRPAPPPPRCKLPPPLPPERRITNVRPFDPEWDPR